MPKSIYISNADLTRDKRSTFLNQDVVATGSTIRVQSLVGFQSLSTSSGQIVIIGELGNEQTEIRRTSNSAALSSTYNEVTLRDALLFDHPQDTKVTVIDFDRVEIQHAVTVSGSKSTIAAYPFNIHADSLETLINDSTKTSGFYFVRFNETIGDTNSDWSDPIPYRGFDDNMVAAIKQRALDDMHEIVDGEIITNDFLNSSLWEARREYHKALGKRPFRRKFNVNIGSALTGSFRIELPADAEEPTSGENIYGVRIGAHPNMSYYDKKEWDFDWRDKPRSSLAVPYVYGLSTSIWLANGRDFADSAVISVEGVNISVTRIAGLTGESYYNSFRIYAHPSPGWSASAGSDAYSNVSYGLPDRFTVFADPEGSAYVYFNRPIDTAYIGQNIYADYYRTLVGYNSDYDTLDEPDYDMYCYYLKAKIRHRKNRGEGDITKDPDYQLWLAKKEENLAKEYLGTEIRFSPDVPYNPPRL